MTITLKVYGHSDDLLEFEGAASEEICKPDGPAIAKVIAPNGDGLLVVGNYIHQGTWAIGVAPLEEDVPMPDWNARLTNYIEGKNGMYSAMLLLDVPEGITVTQVTR